MYIFKWKRAILYRIWINTNVKEWYCTILHSKHNTSKSELFFPSNQDKFALNISCLCLLPLVTKSICLQRQGQGGGEKDNQGTRPQIRTAHKGHIHSLRLSATLEFFTNCVCWDSANVCPAVHNDPVPKTFCFLNVCGTRKSITNHT